MIESRCMPLAKLAKLLYMTVGLMLVSLMNSASAEERNFTSSTIEANGITFHYWEAGEGPIILALHGFPDHARGFRHQLRDLSQAGYRVIAPNMRGYAPTDVPLEGRFDVNTLADDAIALAKAFSDDQVILMGHDWGAAAAHVAAMKAPERFSKIVTISVPYGTMFQHLITNPEQQRRSWYIFFFQSPLAEKTVPLNNFAFIERLWRDWSPGWDIPEKELALVKETFSQPDVLLASLRYYRDSFNPSNKSAKKQKKKTSSHITVPTLYVHGRDDGGVGVELTEDMDKFYTGEFKKVIIKNAGHFVHQERPKEFNQTVLSFLNGNKSE